MFSYKHRGAGRDGPAHRLAGLLAAVTLAGVVGCRTYEPLPLDPIEEWQALLVRQDERSSSVLLGSSQRPGNIEWFPLAREVDSSDGLDLGEANRLAWYHNAEVLRAREQTRVEIGKLHRAGLLDNPELFLGPRISTKSNDVIFPASLSWKLPLWGLRDAEKEHAWAGLRVARLALHHAEIEALVAVRELYLELHRVDAELEILQAIEGTSTRVADWARTLASAGEVDAGTAWLSSWERSQLAALNIEKTSERRRLESELLQTVGLLPTDGVRIDTAGITTAAELADAELEVMLRHPHLRAAATEYELSEAALRLEIARQYPTVTLGPEFEDDDGDSSIGIGLGLELPLFDRNRGNIVAAEARRDAARKHFQAVLVDLSHESARARAEAETSRELLRALRNDAVGEATAALEALRARLELGESTVLEVLTTQRALVDARFREIRLETQIAQAVFTAAVAGGWAFDPPPEPEERKP